MQNAFIGTFVQIVFVAFSLLLLHMDIFIGSLPQECTYKCYPQFISISLRVLYSVHCEIYYQKISQFNNESHEEHFYFVFYISKG
jgi:hypothetical protein